MIYRFLYEIRCTAEAHELDYYRGQHTTDNLNDGYTGSGIRILRYLKKHPGAYIKEIISFHDSQEELDIAEYNFIHPVLNDPHCLNIAEGGHGGFTGYHKEETKKHLSERKQEYYKTHSSWNKGIKCGPMSEEAKSHMKGRTPWNKGKHMPEEAVQKQTESLKEYYKTHSSWNKGMTASEESRNKMSESHKDKHWKLENGHRIYY